MVNKDKVLVNLVERQTDLFNRDAPEIEKMAVLMSIQEYQKHNRDSQR
jgi:hypothetical protein